MSLKTDLAVRPGGQDLGRTRSAQRKGEEEDFGRLSPALASGALRGSQHKWRAFVGAPGV